jgi:hypothetical protein
MEPNQHSLTGDYFQTTQKVLNAGRQLLDSIQTEDDLEALQYAVTQLEAASDTQGSISEGYRAFLFSEAEAVAPRRQEVVREQVLEEVFTSVLTDIQVGNVLLAAGQGLGEGDGQPRPGQLADALSLLEGTAATLKTTLRDGARLFNFTEEAGGRGAPPSTIEEAVEGYRQRANETLDLVVKGAYGVTTAIVEALKQLSPETVLKALESLGGPIKAVAGFVGRLINKGIEKIKAAVETLVDFIGNDAVKKIKDKLAEFLKEAAEGGFAESLLGRFVGAEVTRASIKQRLDGGGLDRVSLNEGSDELRLLAATYQKNMEMAKKAVTAITFASGIIGLTSLGPQNAALFAGVGYCTVLAVVILLAMDYADSGRVLGRVRGVGVVTEGLRPAAAPSA